MKITLHVSHSLAVVLGGRTLPVELPDNTSVADMLARLQVTFPQLEGRLKGTDNPGGAPYNYFVNRKAVKRAEMATLRLRDGDRVHILVPVVGG